MLSFTIKTKEGEIMFDYSEMPKRKCKVTPTEDMVNVNTEYLMDICDRKGFDLKKASTEMEFNEAYLYTAIYDGRMNKYHLAAMSKILHFPYKNALAC